MIWNNYFLRNYSLNYLSHELKTLFMFFFNIITLKQRKSNIDIQQKSFWIREHSLPLAVHLINIPLIHSNDCRPA